MFVHVCVPHLLKVVHFVTCSSHKGSIYGNKIKRKEEDNLKLVIDNVFKKFHPMVDPHTYRVTFTPVARYLDVMVLEIRIQPGDHAMYEDIYHQVS